MKAMSSYMKKEEKSSIEAATEAIAKVNAMLIAKGKLKPSQVNSSLGGKKTTGAQSNLITTEVDINEVPIGCRNMLTRGSTQEEISKMSGAAVATRGRYMTQEERARNPSDRALYLSVQATTQDAVNSAVGRINEIIANGIARQGGKASRFSPALPPRGSGPQFHQGQRPNLSAVPPPPTLMSPPPSNQNVPVLQEKLFIGLEHAPPNFGVKEKVIGPGASFLQHIQAETGAKVSVRGKNSGFVEANGQEAMEPMHIHIQHVHMMGLQQAKELATNLIQTVQQEYAAFQHSFVFPPPNAAPQTPLMIPPPQMVSLAQPPPMLPGQPQMVSLSQPVPVQPPQTTMIPPPAVGTQMLQQAPPQQAIQTFSVAPPTSMGQPIQQYVQSSEPQLIAGNPPPVGSQHQILVSMAAPGQPTGQMVITTMAGQPAQMQQVTQYQQSLPPPGTVHLQAQPGGGIQPISSSVPQPQQLQQQPGSLSLNVVPQQPSLQQQAGIQQQPQQLALQQQVQQQQQQQQQQQVGAQQQQQLAAQQQQQQLAAQQQQQQHQQTMIQQTQASSQPQHIQQQGQLMQGPPQVASPATSVPQSVSIQQVQHVPVSIQQQVPVSMQQAPLQQVPVSIHQVPVSMQPSPQPLQQPLLAVSGQLTPGVSGPPQVVQQLGPVPVTSWMSATGQPVYNPPVSAQSLAMSVVQTQQGTNGGVIMSSPQTQQPVVSSLSSSPVPSTMGYVYNPGPREEPKRRFTEVKQEDKLPDNVLGYEHGPPHLTNLVVQPGQAPQHQQLQPPPGPAESPNPGGHPSASPGPGDPNIPPQGPPGQVLIEGHPGQGGPNYSAPQVMMQQPQQHVLQQQQPQLSPQQQQQPQQGQEQPRSEVDGSGMPTLAGSPSPLQQAQQQQQQQQQHQQQQQQQQQQQGFSPQTNGDKLLMPPPPPPPGVGLKRPGDRNSPHDTGEPRKKGKGFRDEDDDIDIPSSMASQGKEFKKYSYNQYSSTPQLYMSPDRNSPGSGGYDQGYDQMGPPPGAYDQGYGSQQPQVQVMGGSPGPGGEPPMGYQREEQYQQGQYQGDMQGSQGPPPPPPQGSQFTSGAPPYMQFGAPPPPPVIEEPRRSPGQDEAGHRHRDRPSRFSPYTEDGSRGGYQPPPPPPPRSYW